MADVGKALRRGRRGRGRCSGASGWRRDPGALLAGGEGELATAVDADAAEAAADVEAAAMAAASARSHSKNFFF